MVIVILGRSMIARSNSNSNFNSNNVVLHHRRWYLRRHQSLRLLVSTLLVLSTCP